MSNSEVTMGKLTNLSQEMAVNGYPIQDLQPDGEYHRFPLSGGGNGSPGYYLLQETAAGYRAVYGDFVSGRKYCWTSDNGKPLSPDEAERLKANLADDAKEFEARLKRKHEKGAMAARFFWETGRDANSHPYLKDKKVNGYGLKVCDNGDYANSLMVPGYNNSGMLCTVQYINRDGQKRFETGSQKKGAFYEIAGEGDKIIIAEGYSTAASIHEATGHTVIVAFDAGNLVPVAEIIRKKYGTDLEIVIAADNDQWKPEVGNIGIEAATNAAIEIDAKVAIPEFKDDTSQPTDFNDLASLESLSVVADQVAAAKPVGKVQALKAECDKLLSLDPIEREFDRDRLSAKYNVRKSVIDKYLSKESKKSLDESIKSVVSETQPAADPVDGNALLNQISDGLTSRVILPEGAADAISLWIMLTYCHNAFNVLPILGVTSPTKRCGKTTLIEILQGLTDKGLAASNLTPAAIFRTIEKFTPTLLIDEADTFLKNNDEMRGILNSGHTRASAFVIRLEGDNHEPVKFSTWGPKAIGMIGTLPDTLEDRSIVIQLARKMPSEKIIKTGLDFAESCIDIRSKCSRWAIDNLARLKSISVSVPTSGSDRADDNWYPLFAIANVIGGDWPEKVAKAMPQLVSASDDAIGTKLLADIRDIFNEQSAERMFSKDLVARLNELTESPWGDWKKGTGLTPNGLSRLLKPFGVKSKDMRIDDDRLKGYTLQSFQDALSRYIPHIQTATPRQYNEFNNLDENRPVTQDKDVTDEKHGKQLSLFDCHGVTDGLGDIQGKESIDSIKTEKWEAGTI